MAVHINFSCLLINLNALLYCRSAYFFAFPNAESDFVATSCYREIIVYSRSTINACSLLSHE